MSFSKKTYVDKKSVITAENLNEIQDALLELQKAGIAGADGGYYIPAVDSDGNLTWTASQSDMPEVAGANIKGPKGDTGPAGADGATPVRGVDYWTEEDQAAMVNAVLDALPDADEISY